jgi:hypothetical protein
MAILKSSVEKVYQTIETEAKGNGVRDGDMDAVYRVVKATLVDAGWATSGGEVSFVSAEDAQNAMGAVRDAVLTLSKGLANRKVVLQPGSQPTKNHVSSASAVSFQSVPQAVAGGFHATMAKVGDTCPKCNGSMQQVLLVNERSGLYCSKDRVVLPLG